MSKIIKPFIITFLAGISTTLGIIPTYFNNKYKNIIINISLSFAAGVMITISCISLIPEALKYLNSTINITSILFVLIFINIGIIISNFSSKILSKKFDNDFLYNIGIVSLIALIFHNIPEGIITFLTSSKNIKIGLSLSLAIALHNIPEGISIAIPIYYSTNKRKKALIYTIVAGFSEFLGAIIAYIFLNNYINNFIMSLVLGITAGVMFQISSYELLPTALKYKNYLLSFFGLFLGNITMIICIFIFKV